MSRTFYSKVEQAKQHPPCVYCGGRWSYSLGRIYHRGHPRDCWRKEQQDRRRQDTEATALRGDGPIRLDCGCYIGRQHESSTCERFYFYYPEAETGQEYRWEETS